MAEHLADCGTDSLPFRAALVRAGFHTQWQKSYGAEAWARLEWYTGPLA